jgi:hypothetical protein
MSLKKTVAIAAAAGALAAISVPAMAFENEFHGMYKFKFIVSDFDNGGSGTDSQLNVTTLKHAQTANSYLEQRARILYTAKASDDLKLVTAFELDARFGGTNSGKYGPTSATDSTGKKITVVGTTDAGSLDADGVSLETKWVYLDFNIPSTPTNVKVGIMPYKDAFKGIFLDADVAAVYTKTKLGAATVGAGFTRVYDGQGLQIAGPGGSTGSYTGDKATNVFMLDGAFDINKDVKVGMSYYFVNDNMPVEAGLGSWTNVGAGTFTNGSAGLSTQTLLHTVGLTADAKIGAAKISGFAATQFGSFHRQNAKNSMAHGFALNAAGALPIGPGSLRTAALYTSGDDGLANSNGSVSNWVPIKTYKNVTGAPSTGGSASSVTSYNESGMMLLMRNTAQNNTNTDRYMIGTPDNSGKGVFLYTVGYDANLTPKVYVNTNVGLAWANKNGIGATAATHNGCNYMGTEVNVEAGYKLYDNLTAAVQGAYVVLGGAYRGDAVDTLTKPYALKTPENPYTGRVVLSYAF